MKDSGDPNRTLLTFSDFLLVFKRSKRKILLWGVVVGVLFGLIALIRPISYKAEGTFKEKATKGGNIPNSMLQIFGSSSLNQSESEAISLVKSRSFLQNIIQEYFLQAQLSGFSQLESPFKLIKKNLKIATASLTFSRLPIFEAPICDLKFTAFNYSGENPLNLIISLNDDDSFNVTDKDNQARLLPQGQLGQNYQLDHLTFILDKNTQSSHDKLFFLRIDSLDETCQTLCRNLDISSLKTDKSFLKFTLDGRNRHLCSDLLNQIMDRYEEYLKINHEKLAWKQLDYLNQRRNQLTSNLTTLMESHAEFLSKDLYSAGFIETDKEMEFLARRKHEYKERLLANEIEIQRLEQLSPKNFTHYDRYSQHEGDPMVINTLFTEMRALRQQRDSLEIELQKKSADFQKDLKHSFKQQVEELNLINYYQEELKEIQKVFANSDWSLLKDYRLIEDPRFVLKNWIEKLEKSEQDTAQQHYVRENFKYYLGNLDRLFGVHKRILEERLTHQQNPSEEYQGMTLVIVSNLYVDYSKQRVELENLIRQSLFSIQQIEDPNFEITSLSSQLTDPVSIEMIRKASELVLNLHDQNNQSQRDQERLKESLHLQRTFLSMHLKQMVQLMELNKQLIDEKIFSLRNISLELLHQQISLSEKNLQEYIESRLENLHQEKQMIKKHLDSLHVEMAILPDKWVREQLIDQEVVTNRMIVEEIAKMVESKNISHNLEVIQSSPLDRSIPPVRPAVPPFFLYAILGGFLGISMRSGIALFHSFNQGIEVSAFHLRSQGHHISGTLEAPLHEKKGAIKGNNLDTLRRIQAFFDHYYSTPKDLKLALLLEGKGPHYAFDLTNLFAQRGQNALIIDLDESIDHCNSTTGLLQYLKGEIPFPTIEKRRSCDCILFGGKDPFVSELLRHSRFSVLMDQLKTRYDWILLVSRLAPTSASAESLIQLFPLCVVTLSQEKMENLDFYSQFIHATPPQLTFILTHKTRKKKIFKKV